MVVGVEGGRLTRRRSVSLLWRQRRDGDCAHLLSKRRRLYSRLKPSTETPLGGGTESSANANATVNGA